MYDRPHVRVTVGRPFKSSHRFMGRIRDACRYRRIKRQKEFTIEYEGSIDVEHKFGKTGTVPHMKKGVKSPNGKVGRIPGGEDAGDLSQDCR